MKFWEAMKALEEGKKVRCREWVRCLWVDKKSLNSAANVCIDLSHDTDTDWELYEKPLQLHSLWELIPALKEGKTVRRENGWDHPIHGISMRQPLRYVGSETSEQSGQKHFFSIEDLEASDWIVCE